jgi:hypothetical protein
MEFKSQGGASMKLFSVVVVLAIMGLGAAVLPQASWAGVGVGINIGVPAPAYYPPAYVYGPLPVYGPAVVVGVGPRYYGRPWHHHPYHKHYRHGYHHG